MLQLKKRDAAPVVAPAWHPNFRNFERLPDTKVVRTTFFINVAAGALALVLVGIVGWREYQADLYAQQTFAAQERIDRNQKQNAEALRLTKAFNDEEKKFAEAAAFTRAPMTATEFVTLLSQTLPREIQLEHVDFRPHDANNPQCVVRGLVAGAKDQASGSASAYVELLRTDPRLASIFSSVELRALNPEPNSGTLIFEIALKFTNPAATAGGKK
jgi:hypothetical protein